MGNLFKKLLKLLGIALFAISSTVAYADYQWNFPEPVTPIARDTMHVHNLFSIICIVIFLVVLAIMIYSIINHRKGKMTNPSTATGPTTAVQIFWTSVPFLILLYLDFIVIGIPAWHAITMMEDTKTDAQMVIKVTGSQWKWQYDYPEEGISFVSTLSTPANQIDNSVAKGEHYLLEVDNPLVLPINKKIRFLMTSSDVIHEWWVPAFASKRNAIPGFIREIWATIEKPGTYRGQCTELCGKGHGYMPVVVEAVTQEKYDEWVAIQKQKMQPSVEVSSADKAGEVLNSQAKVQVAGVMPVAAAN